MTMGPMGSHLWTNSTSSSSKSGGNNVSGIGIGGPGASLTSNSSSSNQFMLSQVSDDDSSDYSLEDRKKREFFVEELVLASLVANTKLHNDQDDS